MKTGFVLFLVAVLGLLALGCTTTTVEIPPAHVGKIQSQGGLADEVISPGLIKLPNRCAGCPNLVLSEVSDFAAEEAIRIFMPKDQLNLEVDIRGVYAIDRDKIDEVFNRIPPEPLRKLDAVTGETSKQQRVTVIPMERVYQTYAQQVVREVARSFLTQHTIIDVMRNREALGDELQRVVREELADTPVTAIKFGFADIQPPSIIITANEQAKEREIAIQRAEAEKQVSLTQAEARRAVALKQQEIDLIEAETQRLVQEVLNKAVSPAFVTQRYLKVLEALAQNPNTVFMPFEALPAEGGIGFRMFASDIFDEPVPVPDQSVPGSVEADRGG